MIVDSTGRGEKKHSPKAFARPPQPPPLRPPASPTLRRSAPAGSARPVLLRRRRRRRQPLPTATATKAGATRPRSRLCSCSNVHRRATGPAGPSTASPPGRPARGRLRGSRRQRASRGRAAAVRKGAVRACVGGCVFVCLLVCLFFGGVDERPQAAENRTHNTTHHKTTKQQNTVSAHLRRQAPRQVDEQPAVVDGVEGGVGPRLGVPIEGRLHLVVAPDDGDRGAPRDAEELFLLSLFVRR